MFHLQPRVHFHEVELAAVEQEFDGPGAQVADLACHHQRRGAQARTQLLGQRGCRRLFDELLMASLRRAVALAQVHEVALAVGKHLHLDVARLRQIALQEQRPVAEGALGEAACGGERRRQFGSVAHDLHALAAAPGRGFDDERQPGALRLAREVLQALLGAGVPGQHRHAGRAHARLGDDLRTHRGDGRGGGSDENAPRVRARLGELRVLGEEPVARMDGLRPARAGGFDEALDAEITVARRGGPDPHRLIGFTHVARAGVGVREHRDGAQPQPACGAENAAGYLAAIGDQKTVDHGALRSRLTSGTRQSASAVAARCAPPRATTPVHAAFRWDRSRHRPTAAPKNNRDVPGARIARESAA